MIYAEQIMMDKKRNQWFILFHLNNPEWNENVLTSHMNWFQEKGLTATLVGGMGDRQPQGNLYHVDFANAEDPRLREYCDFWETASGESKVPHQYHMLEWNYIAWVENDGVAEFERFLAGQ